MGIDSLLGEVYLIAAKEFFCSEIEIIIFSLLKNRSRVSRSSSLKSAPRDVGSESHLRKINIAVSLKSNILAVSSGKRFDFHRSLNIRNTG